MAIYFKIFMHYFIQCGLDSFIPHANSMIGNKIRKQNKFKIYHTKVVLLLYFLPQDCVDFPTGKIKGEAVDLPLL